MVADLEIRQTMAARTAQAIRERILTLTPGYAPGQRLFPDALADSLGVSITPVREALRLLSHEGLVELLPRRGVRVASMSLDEIRDLTAVRGGIELLAVRFRGENYSPDEIAELRSCLGACAQAIERLDAVTYRQFDTQIHRLIVVGSKSQTLIGVYEQLHRRAQILELYFTDDWNPYRESLSEHREIVEMLATAPMEAIERAVWDHWARSRTRISARFRHLAESLDTRAVAHIEQLAVQPPG